MKTPAPLLIDPSQFPKAVQRDLVASLRAGEVNHKFHYVSYYQAEKWLAIHEAYSPLRQDSDCQRVYDRAFAAAAKLPVHEVIGLGCGSGEKEARLLSRICGMTRRRVHFTPVDVSVPLVLAARQRASEVLPETRVRPGRICDLAKADPPLNLSGGSKLMTFFGVLPNFEPESIIPRVSALLGKGDFLLCSANLAPGTDYTKGVRTILPQYENGLTNEWLTVFLTDLGIGRDGGTIEWSIEPASGLLRVTAYFRFSRDVQIVYTSNRFKFAAGDRIRLFFSYRYTPRLLEKLLGAHRVSIKRQWITRSQEEGVFLCVRA